MKLSPKSTRWLIVLAVVAALVATILVATPYAIQRLAKDWIEQNGGERVRIGDVDFNPFTAILIFRDVEVEVEDRKPLHFDKAYLQLAWLPLLDRHIEVTSLELEGFHMAVRNRDALRIGGILIAAGKDTAEAAPPAETENPWLAGIDAVTLKDFTLFYEDQKLATTVFIDNLTLSQLAQWNPEEAARLEYQGKVNDAPIELDALLAPFAATPSYKGNLRIEKLSLARFEPLAKPALEKLAGLLSLDGSFEVTQGAEETRVVHDGRLALESLELVQESAHIRNQSTEWQGKTDLHIPAGGEPRVQANGKLGSRGLKTDLPQQAFRLTWNGLDLDGAFTWDAAAADTQPGVKAQLAIDGLDLTVPEKQVDVVSAQKIDIDRLVVEGTDSVRVASVVATGLDLGRELREQATKAVEENRAIFHGGRVSLTELSYIDGFTTIGHIVEEDTHVVYHRDKDGNWKVNSLLAALSGKEKENGETAETAGTSAPEAPAEKPAESAGTGAAKPPADGARIAIGRIEVAKGSTATFLDEAVKPVFREVITVDELWMEKLDSRKPAQASPLKLVGRIGKHTRLSASGDVRPFLQPPGIDLQAEVFAMDLPKLSSYTRESMGLLLDSGTLDVDLKLVSKDKAMKGKLVLKLHQLTLESTGSKDGLASKLPVPMDVALDTLRDKNNTIELDIPIEGDAENPDFDLSDAINQVVAKAVVTGATSYLKYALQPYGTLLLVAEYAGEAATRVRLDPIEFEPGQATMDDTDRDYLSRVAKILKDRPKLAIKLCGVAVQKDVEYFRQQAGDKKNDKPKTGAAAEAPAVDEEKLTSLAKQRAATVKDYLIDEFKAPADHLVGCRPRLETDDAEAAPRTDILI